MLLDEALCKADIHIGKKVVYSHFNSTTLVVHKAYKMLCFNFYFPFPNPFSSLESVFLFTVGSVVSYVNFTNACSLAWAL